MRTPDTDADSGDSPVVETTRRRLAVDLLLVGGGVILAHIAYLLPWVMECCPRFNTQGSSTEVGAFYVLVVLSSIVFWILTARQDDGKDWVRYGAGGITTAATALLELGAIPAPLPELHISSSPAIGIALAAAAGGVICAGGVLNRFYSPSGSERVTTRTAGFSGSGYRVALTALVLSVEALFLSMVLLGPHATTAIAGFGPPLIAITGIVVGIVSIFRAKSRGAHLVAGVGSFLGMSAVAVWLIVLAGRMAGG